MPREFWSLSQLFYCCRRLWQFCENNHHNKIGEKDIYQFTGTPVQDNSEHCVYILHEIHLSGSVLLALRYASAGTSYGSVSVPVCVCHESVFYRNG